MSNEQSDDRVERHLDVVRYAIGVATAMSVGYLWGWEHSNEATADIVGSGTLVLGDPVTAPPFWVSSVILVLAVLALGTFVAPQLYRRVIADA